jgi:hypothetical protein
VTTQTRKPFHILINELPDGRFVAWVDQPSNEFLARYRLTLCLGYPWNAHDSVFGYLDPGFWIIKGEYWIENIPGLADGDDFHFYYTTFRKLQDIEIYKLAKGKLHPKDIYDARTTTS